MPQRVIEPAKLVFGGLSVAGLTVAVSFDFLQLWLGIAATALLVIYRMIRIWIAWKRRRDNERPPV